MQNVQEMFDHYDLDINDFDYDLPKEKIALYPLENRDASKLLFADATNNKIVHSHFQQIGDFLPDGSLVVLNSTKVIAARLRMQKPTGGKVELLCVNPILPSTDPQITVAAKEKCTWECIVGGKNVSEGMPLKSIGSKIYFEAKILKRYANYAKVEFHYSADASFSEVLQSIGDIPLPPYIARETNESDFVRYQTVYSKADGSVAAPTAGLHFTSAIIDSLSSKNIELLEVILHVGPGTFKPIDGDISKHDMHKEQFFVSAKAIEKLIKAKANGQKIIATGTTSLRTLESLYWIGVKARCEGYEISHSSAMLDQNEPYTLSEKYDEVSLIASFEAISEQMSAKNLEYISGETKLFILPKYKIRTSDGLITNFHLPKSTLLLLVSAFIGEDMRLKIYEEALKNDYRFLSYGDSSFLLR